MISPFPKKTKFRKSHKMHRTGCAYSGNRVVIGEFGLQAITNGLIQPKHIESARVTINRSIKKIGKIVIRVFPDKPVTKKAIGTRMGKGKGNVEFWVSPILRGKIIFELVGVKKEQAEEAFKKASYKLPFRTRLIERDTYEKR